MDLYLSIYLSIYPSIHLYLTLMAHSWVQRDTSKQEIRDEEAQHGHGERNRKGCLAAPRGGRKHNA
jgi:hypothetical protein